MDVQSILTDLRNEHARITRAIDALQNLNLSSTAEPAPVVEMPRRQGRRRKRTMSAEARQRISEAAKKRWALRRKSMYRRAA